jgi:hypothetical protein
VTFPRLPDHQRGHALVEHDSGVVYTLRLGPDRDGRLPHDLIHLTVERTLGIQDGIWGLIAAGMVTGMTPARGRRPPHAEEQSRAMMRAYARPIMRAELLAGLVRRIANGRGLGRDSIARLAREHLCTLPDADAQIDPIQLLLAAERLREAERHWRDLPVGATMIVQWPVSRRMTRSLLRPQPATRRVPTRANRLTG